MVGKLATECPRKKTWLKNLTSFLTLAAPASEQKLNKRSIEGGTTSVKATDMHC